MANLRINLSECQVMEIKVMGDLWRKVHETSASVQRTDSK